MTHTTAPRTRRRAVRDDSPPMRILVATAGQPDTEGAITVASLLARRTHALVDVLTVVAPFPHLAPAALRFAPPAVMDEENRREAFDTVRAQIAAAHHGDSWRVYAEVGWPADTIVDAARKWGATLIVAGMGRHGAIDRFIGSETAVSIAHRANVPVLVVPEDITRLPVNAAAAIDFTPSSAAAARLAATLLAPTGVLTLVHASMLAKATVDPGTLMDVYTTGARDKLVALGGEITAQTGRKVAVRLTEGPVADALLAAAEADHFDLIALGSHERGLIDRLLMGSVRTRVLRHARVPVLVTPELPSVTP